MPVRKFWVEFLGILQESLHSLVQTLPAAIFLENFSLSKSHQSGSKPGHVVSLVQDIDIAKKKSDLLLLFFYVE